VSWSLDDWNITENWVKTYPAGRVCASEGCGTLLRRSNPADTCELHSDDLFVTDTLLFGAKRCPTCEAPKPRTSEHFGTDVSSADGLTWECSECHNAAQRAHRRNRADYERGRYQTDPEYREQKKAASRENKARRYATDPEYRARVKAQALASKARCKARGSG